MANLPDDDSLRAKARDLIYRRSLEGGESCECWLWQGETRVGRGYSKTTFAKRQVLVHRLSLWAFHRKSPEGMLVMHSCDEPLCVNPFHLSLGTNADNMADRYRKGRVRHGERHWRARLTDAQVLEMRALRASGWKLAALAERFGVGIPYACTVTRGKSRKRAA